VILSPSIRRTAQRRGVHLSRLDPDANVPTDARRNNGAPAHAADCACPFCRPAEFPRHLDLRMSEEMYSTIATASEVRGDSRAKILRTVISEVRESRFERKRITLHRSGDWLEVHLEGLAIGRVAIRNMMWGRATMTDDTLTGCYVTPMLAAHGVVTVYTRELRRAWKMMRERCTP